MCARLFFSEKNKVLETAIFFLNVFREFLAIVTQDSRLDFILYILSFPVCPASGWNTNFIISSQHHNYYPEMYQPVRENTSLLHHANFRQTPLYHSYYRLMHQRAWTFIAFLIETSLTILQSIILFYCFICMYILYIYIFINFICMYIFINFI